MLEQYIVKPTQTVKQVVTAMDEEGIKAVAVVSDDQKLLGVFTAGDMRKYFLMGGDLNAEITTAMNSTPIVFHSLYEAREYPKKLIFYPIVDEDGKLVNVLGEQRSPESTTILNDVPVVIMAGGKGTRLYPYTQILPKALIPIGDLTITERIINSFRNYGCKNFHMILNHKAGMIRSYFNEVEKDYELSFEEEREFLGTGGGLQYLKGKVENTFFLSNCDVLLNADIECIYKTHKQSGNKITVVCAMMDVQIPYGVIDTNDSAELLNIKEKPELSYLTNTGIYVVEPEVIDELEENQFIHMTDIAMNYVRKGEKVGIFPISKKSWMDMGQIEEMEQMKEQLGV